MTRIVKPEDMTDTYGPLCDVLRELKSMQRDDLASLVAVAVSQAYAKGNDDGLAGRRQGTLYPDAWERRVA